MGDESEDEAQGNKPCVQQVAHKNIDAKTVMMIKYGFSRKSVPVNLLYVAVHRKQQHDCESTPTHCGSRAYNTLGMGLLDSVESVKYALCCSF